MMTKREILTLASVLIGFSLLFSGLVPAIGLAADQLGIGPDLGVGDAVLWFLSENIIDIVAGMFLILSAGPISGLFFADDEPKVSSRSDCAEVALTVLGFYLFTHLISGGSEIIREIATTISFNVTLNTVRLLPDAIALLLYVIVGLWLIKNAKRLATKITAESAEAMP